MKTVSIIKALSCLIVPLFVVQSNCIAADEHWQPGRSRVEEAPVLVNEARGNWYNKQEYYKKARADYEQIRERVNVIEGMEKVFESGRHDSRNLVSRFNLEIGFTQGEVDGLLTDLIKDLNIERERTTQLSEVERKSLEEIKEKKGAIEKLKKSFELIDGFEDALNKSMKNVRDKVVEAKKFEERAWVNYTQIAQEISDKKAEQLYLEIKTFLSNIDESIKYLGGGLKSFFDSKIKELQDKMQSIREETHRLKARGIELAKKVEAEERADITQEKKEKVDELRKEAAKRAELEKKAREEKSGLWQSFKKKISAGLAYVKNLGSSRNDVDKKLSTKQ